MLPIELGEAFSGIRFALPGDNQPQEMVMRRLNTASICLLAVTLALMGLYELTAKSPRLMGQPLPGWHETQQVEKMTPWNPTTGFPPLDRILHEGEEALRFYGFFKG
jgi:hypothetical protein